MKLLFTVIMSVLLSACLMLAGVAFYKLKEADKALRPLLFKVGINVARKYMFREKKK